MEKRIITLGFYDNGTGRHQNNTVYHFKWKTPAVTTITGGDSADKGVKKVEKKCKQIGVIDSGGYEKVNRVYRGGV